MTLSNIFLLVFHSVRSEDYLSHISAVKLTEKQIKFDEQLISLLFFRFLFQKLLHIEMPTAQENVVRERSGFE